MGLACFICFTQIFSVVRHTEVHFITEISLRLTTENLCAKQMKQAHDTVLLRYNQLLHFELFIYDAGTGAFAPKFCISFNPIREQRTPREEKAFTERPKFTPTPKCLGTAKAYFVCHFGPIFQISLIYAFIGCP